MLSIVITLKEVIMANINLNKSKDFFNPDKVTETCHIIGCGSIGSNVAELLARYGVRNIALYDFDTVESHNVANQIFTNNDVGRKKVDALSEILESINSDIAIKKRGKYENEHLNGYVFMCVDSVEVRNQIVDANYQNPMIRAIFDFRTTLLEGQCYYANWKNKAHKESLKNSLAFTHEEAQANTPVSACGFELSVAPVVKMCSIMGVANFTNLINENTAKPLILCRPYEYFLESL